MAIFNKDAMEKGAETTKGGAAPQGEAALSIVAAGMKITGDVDTTGVLKIEGTLQGTVRSARQVLLGRQGEIKGDVNAREVVVGGRVDGSIRAVERVEVQGTSVVNGDIYTKSIVVLEGGKINGAVRMDEPMMAGNRLPSDMTPKAVAVVR